MWVCGIFRGGKIGFPKFGGPIGNKLLKTETHYASNAPEKVVCRQKIKVGDSETSFDGRPGEGRRAIGLTRFCRSCFSAQRTRCAKSMQTTPSLIQYEAEKINNTFEAKHLFQN
jgi:hypothetical protein